METFEYPDNYDVKLNLQKFFLSEIDFADWKCAISEIKKIFQSKCMCKIKKEITISLTITLFIITPKTDNIKLRQ